MTFDVERYLRLYACAVVVVLSFGLFLALKLEEYEWINRSGTLLVVLSLSLTLAQFVYESKLAKIISEKRKFLEKVLEERAIFSEEKEAAVAGSMREFSATVEGVRYRILIRSLIVAAVGEVLHGFGDLVLSGGIRLLSILSQTSSEIVAIIWAP